MPIISSAFDIDADSQACGKGERLVRVTYLFPVSSTAYIKSSAMSGIITSIIITSVKFIKNTKVKYPTSSAYYPFYNDLYYEDQLCDQATANTLAIAYWEEQKELTIRQLEAPCS